MTEFDPTAWYRESAQRSAVRLSEVGRRLDRLGATRVAVFVAALTALGWGVTTSNARARAVAFGFLFLAIGVFVVLVIVHGRARALDLRLAAEREYHQRALARLARDWTALAGRSVETAPADHPYAADLDILGRASLLTLLDVVTPSPGRPMLRGWLLESASDATEVRARQDAVRELAARDDLRSALGTHARLLADLDPEVVSRFLSWCDEPSWVLRRQPLLWSARALTVLTLGLIVAQAVGLLTSAWWLLTAVAALTLASVVRRASNDALRRAALPRVVLAGHGAIARLLAHTDLEADRLRALRRRVAGPPSASIALSRLARLAGWAEVRYSPMLHWTLQALLCWDVHLLARVERWRTDAGAHARDWFAAMGEMESLAALGTLARDNPAWVFPDIDAGASRLEAAALGHPLLPDERRVNNDVTVGPEGTFLLVTGSNMSGKSTLLRAIGMNAVLAHAGGPVCAARYRAPILSVHTSIRISDSLEAGISHFMAELRRLAAVVSAARRAPADRPVLYLLDEILHGTNSAERRVAARAVLTHLLGLHAIGAVTTHDLSLAAEGEVAAAARAVHFTETIDRSSGAPVIHFDYRLRPGLATSTNALALLEVAGLGPVGVGGAAGPGRPAG